MNFLLVLSALAAEATIGCATRVRVKTSGLSSQSGFKAPEVRQPQFAPALPDYFDSRSFSCPVVAARHGKFPSRRNKLPAQER